MNIIRRAFRLAPLLALPIIKSNLWMTSNAAEPVINPQLEEFIKKEALLSAPEQPIDVTQPQSIPSQSNQAKQQTKQTEKPESKAQQQKQEDKETNEAVEPQQKKIQSVQNSQKNDIESIELKQGEVIVHTSCPTYIIDYLEKTNHKIHRTNDPTCKLKLKNRRGDVFTLNSEEISAQGKDEMQLISNYINPPNQLNTVEQAKQFMKYQQKDSFLVCSYLPKQQEYDNLIKSWTRSAFDSFTTTRKAPLHELQQRFTSLAYNSSSNKNTYVIVRNKQVANYLKINSFNIGIPYIINKATRQSGNESNVQWQGTRYHSFNLAKQWKDTFNKEGINHLTHFYINKVDTEQDAYNKVRQIQMSADKRKVLLVYTNESRPDFHKQLDDILQKVARLQKERVVVVKTQNLQLLRDFFKVQPDNFTTIRLFDFNQHQIPLFGSGVDSAYYSRRKLKGPFKFQNVCNMLNAKEWEEYYESKRKLTHIKTVGPQQLKKLDNTLVLLEKEGCQGCNYVEQSLDELKKVTKALMGNYKSKKNVIYRYKIEDPGSLTSLKIRRYNIFNESPIFTPPTTTPKLFIFSEGKLLDLKVEQSLGKIKQVKSDIEAELVHDTVLSDIIDKIRRSQQQTFSEF